MTEYVEHRGYVLVRFKKRVAVEVCMAAMRRISLDQAVAAVSVITERSCHVLPRKGPGSEALDEIKRVIAQADTRHGVIETVAVVYSPEQLRQMRLQRHSQGA